MNEAGVERSVVFTDVSTNTFNPEAQFVSEICGVCESNTQNLLNTIDHAARVVVVIADAGTVQHAGTLIPTAPCSPPPTHAELCPHKHQQLFCVGLLPP